MQRILLWVLAAVGSGAAVGNGLAAEPASRSGAPGKGAPTAATSAPAHQPADPLAHLKPHETRRYRLDLQDCGKETGVDRRLCERSVQGKAAAKSRRRAAGR